MKHRSCHRLMMLFILAGSWLGHANPTGGAVAAGSASIAGEGTGAVTINQASNTAIINWQSFSIGSGELTKFIQPTSDSAALNRVLGGQTSFINGTLSANGQVYLLNGNGIVVGPGGVITTAGFTGSTRDIADSDFLSGHLHFVGSSKAGIKNLGTIKALGGNVVLIGNSVDNAGTINATGTAGLIAGDDVLLAQSNPDGSTITVNPVSAPAASTAKVGVRNTGTIAASSAELKAANGNIYALAIQNKGIIRATTVTQQGGHIYLTSESGTIVNSGTLNASATANGGQGGTVLVKSSTGKVVQSGKIVARGGPGGTGGSAEVSAPELVFTGSIDLSAQGGTTGSLLLDPTTLTVVAGTGGTVDVITAGNDENDPGPSTIGATTVDDILNGGANLTLNADNNVTVNSAISWNGPTTLTLSTNNTAGTSIAINAAITDSDATAGGLTIHTANAADPISATGAINVADFILQNGAWVQNVAPNPMTGVSQLPGFTASNDFEIQGGTFLRVSGGNGLPTSNGTPNAPYQIVDVYGLQGMNGFLGSSFNIGPSPSSTNYNIDASSTATWNGGAGFVPIGTVESPYTGTFAITGGAITSLTIDRPTTNDVALFSSVGNSGEVYYVNLNNASITGQDDVAGLVALNEGTIFNASFNGGSISGTNDVGAFAGENDGTIQYCYINSGTVTGTTLVGGIAGLNTSSIQGCSSYGTITGVTEVGGIAGENDSMVTSAGGSANVNGTTQVGGLVGLNISSATVSTSTFGGSVTGTDSETVASTDVGGLVGENDGTLTGSNTNTGTSVNGDSDVGGLVGYNTGTIEDQSYQGSFNSGTVTGNFSTISEGGNTDIGGVAGLNTGTIMDSYNTGAVTGATNVGGVVGENEAISFNEDAIRENLDGLDFNSQPGIVQTSYNSGSVSSGSNGSASAVGGVVGLNDPGATVNTCYNVGTVGDGSSSLVGGVVGDNFGTVEYTYNSGSVTGSTSAGIIGQDENSASTSDSYWDVTTSTQAIASNNLGAIETALVPLNVSGTPSPYSAASYANFGTATLVPGTNGVYQMGTSPDNADEPAWYIIEGQTRPLLAMEQSLNIQNAHQLQLISENLTGSYYITQYISAGGTTNPSEIWNSSTGFVPIGADPSLSESNYAFTGSLNGEGNTIDSLTIDRPGTNDVGLFGYNAGTNGNTISQITLTNLNITGGSNVGGMAGVNVGTIQNVQIGSSDDASIIVGTGTGVGGVAGLNGSSGEGGTGTITMDVNFATVQGAQVDPPTSIGGLVGVNDVTGVVTQSINEGNVGSGIENNVGGLVGDNRGQVDDSYSTDTAYSSTVSGNSNVGGLVGYNESGAVLETSYGTIAVEGGTVLEESSVGPDLNLDGPGSGTTGALVGTNDGTVGHVYFENDGANSGLPGIGTDNGQSTDVVGYSSSQLTNIQNFAQGASPGLWDFSPQNGEGGGGIWGVNVYADEYINGNYVDGQVNNGLPVLQWQVPVNTEVALSSSTYNYGTAPSYAATGEGASSLSGNSPAVVPILTVSDPTDLNAGSVHTVTFSGTPTQYGFAVEYVNGALTYNGNGQQNGVALTNGEGNPPGYTVVPAPLTITAASYTIPSGGTVPSPTATYGPFAYDQTPSNLNGTLGFIFSPPLAGSNAVGAYAIIPEGQSSPNYAITYVPGTLTITGSGLGRQENQEIATFESELTSITDQFGEDPFNGLDPIYFLSIPTIFGLEGDFLGAINNEGHPDDLVYISSTSSLRALSRLVTPGTGVVTIGDGFVIVGNPQTGAAIYLQGGGHGIPPQALNGLRSVLSPSVYNQLLALIYGHH